MTSAPAIRGSPPAATGSGASPLDDLSPPAPGHAPGTVAHAVVSWLHGELGVDRLFTVPGEAFLPLLAAASAAGVRLVTTRHEAGAGFAAMADARLTGRPGVVAVNRVPGAANASIAVDAARSDPTALLLVVGLPCRGTDPRTGFQATDLEPFLGALGAVERVEGASELPGALARAGAVLTAPQPGPVSLLVPEDVWDDAVVASADPRDGAPAGPSAAPDEVDRVRRALAGAERPVVVAGRLLRAGAGAGADLGPRLGRLGERWGVPVLVGNKQQDLLDNRHPAYGGHLHVGSHPDTRAHLAGADLVVFLGDLPDEVHLAGWYGAQRVLTVHPRPCGPGEHVVADPLAVLDGLVDGPVPAVRTGAGWQASWRELEARLGAPGPTAGRPDGVDFAAVVTALDRHLPDDAVVTLDAGNFSSWVHRYLRVRHGQRMLALAGGAMGFGVPAAVAATLRHPERAVVAVVGDGGLLMSGNELAVARRSGRFPVVVAVDNGGYGTIRAHQHRRFAGTDCGTDLDNPDLCAWAEAFGLPATRVDRFTDVDVAVASALRDPRGGLVHVCASRQAVHANFDLDAGPQSAPVDEPAATGVARHADALRALVGERHVLTGDDVSDRYVQDLRGSDRVGRAVLVARPGTPAELAAVLRHCHEHHQPVVVQGGMTGLVSGAVPDAGEVVVSTERLRRVVEIDPVGATVTAEAGVPLQALQEQAAAHDLAVPIDLASKGSATVGGVVATNAGGVHVVGYGMTRQHVRALQVALADGRLVELSTPLVKDNAGFDLKQLFIGSEGVLGVVTAATIALQPRWRSRGGAFAALPDVDAAFALLAAARSRLPGTLAAFEVMWDDAYRLLEATDVRLPLAPGAPLYALFECHARVDDGGATAEAVAALLADPSLRVLDAAVATDDRHLDAFWAARERIPTEILRIQPFVGFDVSVRGHRLVECLDRMRTGLRGSWPEVRLIPFGHLGDDNLHVAVVTGETTRERKPEIERIVYGAVAACDGSISAEHGVGFEKREWLGFTRTPGEIDMMHALKRLLDPRGILNRGRVLPWSDAAVEAGS